MYRDDHDHDDFVKYWFQFWNPATISEDSPSIRFHLSDYPSWHSRMFGFGYNDWSDTYQGDTCWRNGLTCPSFPISGQHGAFVSGSGTLNWIALPKLSSCYQYQWDNVAVNELVIFSFYLKDKTYRYFICQCLMVLLKQSLLGEPMHFSFWLMREFGNEKSLTHLLNTSYEQLQIDNFYPLIPSILCMSEYDNVMLLANHGCEHLLSLNAFIAQSGSVKQKNNNDELSIRLGEKFGGRHQTLVDTQAPYK
uniref:Uncharacterized protein n=2 Tax=Glycine subgen. Soja TaxID=1462606 RepID=A0A0R0F6T0_SOYBN